MNNIAKAARNTYKTIFSQEVWGGMLMAKIAVHEDWPKEATHDPDDELPPVYKDIPVEICVAGSCIGTTLDKIVDNHKATQDAINQTLETRALELEGKANDNDFLNKNATDAYHAGESEGKFALQQAADHLRAQKITALLDKK